MLTRKDFKMLVLGFFFQSHCRSFFLLGERSMYVVSNLSYYKGCQQSLNLFNFSEDLLFNIYVLWSSLPTPA